MDWGAYQDRLPDSALDRKPQLLPCLDFYLSAYHELLSERQIGMAAGQIPWSKIVQWAYFHGLNDKDDIDTLIRYLRAMEAAAAKVAEKKEKQNDGRKHRNRD